MEYSSRYTSSSRKNLLMPNNKRGGSRSLNPDNARTYRSKTPQPPPPPTRAKSNRKPRKYSNKKHKKTKKTKTPRRFQYRARKDSQPEQEIEEELPDYIKATTPQPHMTYQTSLQRSQSGHNLYLNNNNTSPQDIPQFSPMDASRDNCMFTFVKTQFKPDMGYNNNNNRPRANSNSSLHNNYHNNGYNTQIPLPPMPIIPSNNTTPIPMIHNQLPPHNDDDFHTTKIHQIPKPTSQSQSHSHMSPHSVPRTSMSMRRGSNSSTRARADSGVSNASNSEYGSVLLSTKQMEDQILSHYASNNRSASNSIEHSVQSQSQSQSQLSHSRKQTPYLNSSKSSPKDVRDKKWGFLSKKHTKRKSKSKSKKQPKKRSSRSNSKPFNDEDDIDNNNINAQKRDSVEKEHIFANKLHPAYTPLAPPKSTPPQSNNYNNMHPQINPIPTLAPYNPMQAPHSYILPIHDHDDERNRSNSSISTSDKIGPYPLDDSNSSLHQHVHANINTRDTRGKSKTVGDYEDQFMDDREVAHKSFAYNRSLMKPNANNNINNNDVNMEQMDRDMDKMQFRCDQLDWNLSTLQTNTDKDIRQITAKIHRVEHDMKTQTELKNRTDGHGRRNSIFNSLESSIGAVMRNVESIKDALQTLDLRMSIINQRQHDIFKHIDETKDILDNAATVPVHENQQPALVLNAMDKTATLSSRRASLQSMSEMLRLQSRSMSIRTEEEQQHYINNTNNNPLILPTYDDNEDILNPQSATKKKLMGHIRPELLIQNNSTSSSPQSLISQKIKVLPKNRSNDISIQSSGNYSIAIERTYTVQTYDNVILSPQQQQPQEQPSPDVSNNKLAGIAEYDDDESSTESMLSQERNTAPVSVPPMEQEEEEHDEEEKKEKLVKQTSLSRRKHRHIRSSIASGLSDQIISKIQCETMLIHSSQETDEDFDYDHDHDHELNGNDSDENAECNHKTQEDIDEDKQHRINKENRRRKNKSQSKKSKRPSHSRSINVSVDDINRNSGSTLNTMDIKTLELPVTDKLTQNENRKYSESYSLNPSDYGGHNKNTSTVSTVNNMLHMHQFKTRQRVPNQKTKASDLFNTEQKDNVVPKYLQQTNNNNNNNRRTGSMSYDIGKDINITYEREVSRTAATSALINELDPLGLKNTVHVQHALPLPDDENSDSENDSVSELSQDSMSDLSADNGTFIIHGETLMKALETQKNEQEKEEKLQQQLDVTSDKKKEKNSKLKANKHKKKAKKKNNKMIQLMNCTFILEIVPSTFTIINDFIRSELSRKPSYILTICNNTPSHDLFFKTSQIYNCKSKSLRYFRELTEDNENNHHVSDNDHDNNNDIINIDANDDSDDHLAPMEQMTFGDTGIKKGYHYCGYFVFEAYPFPNQEKSREPSIMSAITPHTSTNTAITPLYNPPITPALKPHAILSAIDEKHNYKSVHNDMTQFNELKLGSMSPSTVNKYRRQSLSTSTRRTSLQFMSPQKGNTMSMNEHSVTSLLGHALDEEHNMNQNYNYPWNDDLDDLIDVVIGYDIELSIGDPELNSFKCYIQFSEYAQPTHYHNQLMDIEKLEAFCHGGSDALQLTHNELITKINVNYKNTIHPQIVFNIAYAQQQNNTHMVKQPSNHETLDID